MKNKKIECHQCDNGKEIDLILTPEIMHYGKYICKNCGGFIQWAKDPNATHSHLMTELETDNPILQFGKHRGFRISAVPDEYLKWMYDADFPEPITLAVENELLRRGLDV